MTARSAPSMVAARWSAIWAKSGIGSLPPETTRVGTLMAPGRPAAGAAVPPRPAGARTRRGSSRPPGPHPGAGPPGAQAEGDGGFDVVGGDQLVLLWRKLVICGDHSSRRDRGRSTPAAPARVDALGRLGRQLQRDPATRRGAHDRGASTFRSSNICRRSSAWAYSPGGSGVLPWPRRSGMCRRMPLRRSARGRHMRPSTPPACTRTTRGVGRRGASCSCLRRQLAAGRVDVTAAGEAHGRAEAVLLEHRLEGRDRLAARALVHAGRVVRDQVDLEHPRIEHPRRAGRPARSGR